MKPINPKNESGYMTANTLPGGGLVTVSGPPPLTAQCEISHKIKDITLYGNTSDGNGVGNYNTETGLYDIPVAITGKNLFSPYSSFTNKGIISHGSAVTVEYTSLQLKPNTKYICSTTAPKSDYNGRTVDAVFITSSLVNPDTASHGVSVNRTRSVTTGASGIAYIMIRAIRTYSEIIITPEDLINGKYTIQLEEGGTATEYSEYSEQKSIITHDTSLLDGMYLKSKLHDTILKSGINHILIQTSVPPSSIDLRYFI